MILIVDDTESSARLFERLLTREGHRVGFARDGAEALETVARDYFRVAEGERPAVMREGPAA